MSDQDKFSELLAVQIASGSKVNAAAKAVGCSETHAYRLNRQPEFRRRVAEIRSEATAAAVGKLSEAATKAVETLVGLMENAGSDVTKCNAAKAILAAVVPLSETLELRERLDALERAQQLKVAG